jgi:diguanylate cyclase
LLFIGNLFFRIFLDLPRYGGWILKANTFCLTGFVLVLVLTATPYELYGVVILGRLSGINGIVAFTTAVLLWRRGNGSAIYFILAWTGISISTAFMVLSMMGRVDYFPAMEHSQALGFVVEVVLLSDGKRVSMTASFSVCSRVPNAVNRLTPWLKTRMQPFTKPKAAIRSR